SWLEHHLDMVGVVGSSPIEPTNENEIQRTSVRGVSNRKKRAAQKAKKHGTSNVDRNNFGATLVEDHIRLLPNCFAVCVKSECGPSIAGPHFFCLAIFKTKSRGNA
ncbi:hypothetical protein, partial [Caballeronia zhejiangensis]|uniref:hypothetical protein n=1 Tax=Caballeronia zhejiangensis TaxID=871203 RepID=UPI001F222DF5